MNDAQTATTTADRSHGLGRLGIWSMDLRFGDQAASREAAAELDDLGYGAIWIPGGIGGDLFTDVERLLNATRRIAIGTGILNLYKHEPAEVGAWWGARTVPEQARLMMGVGVSHEALIGEQYGKPLAAMQAYLDGLDDAAVPRARRCLAALGPKMLALSRDRTAGAHPYLVTPGHTEAARGILGEGVLLAPEQGVILETDPGRARTIARTAVAVYLGMPNYANNWRRLGFSDDDISQASDRLIDGLFAWGSLEQVAARVHEHFAAGADHVCLQVLQATGGTMAQQRESWRQLAGVLL